MSSTLIETLRPLEKMMAVLVRKADKEKRGLNKDELEMYEACRAALALASAPVSATPRISAGGSLASAEYSR